MQRLRYFPFGNQFDLRMGTTAFRPDDLLAEVDEHYKAEIALKRKLLTEDHRYYYRAKPETLEAQWDVLDLVLDHLEKSSPGSFTLDRQGSRRHWINRLTGEEFDFHFDDAGSIAFQPLDWVGRQVQEDLMLLAPDASATLVAGQLCFANGYSLDDKFGLSFLGIHDPAPKMIGPTMVTAQKLLERLPVNRPVWRASWNFKTSDELDLSSRHNDRYRRELESIAPGLDSTNIGPRLFIRIERQTFTRLGRSGYILFGIHTYQNTLERETSDPERAASMLSVLRTTPREMMNYKAITPFETALMGYLEGKANFGPATHGR